MIFKMDDLKKRIPATIGSVDGIFAGHPIDKKKASNLKKVAKRNNVLNEIYYLYEEYYKEMKVTDEHFNKEMKKVRDFFK